MQKGVEWQIQEQLEEVSHYVVLDHTLVNLVDIQLYKLRNEDDELISLISEDSLVSMRMLVGKLGFWLV